MRTPATRPIIQLVLEARRALHMNQRELAEAVGVSERTGQRWAAHGGVPYACFPDLIRLVHPVNVDLAAEIATSRGIGMESLGLATAAPATSAPASRWEAAGLPAKALADSVVCAAASAAKLPPDDQRAPLLAAFKRAKELDMSDDDVNAAQSSKK
jgi:hypothetical protein